MMMFDFRKTPKRYREFIWTGVKGYDRWGRFRSDAAAIPDTRHGIFNAAAAFVREARRIGPNTERGSLEWIMRQDMLASAKAKLEYFRNTRPNRRFLE